jgi:hypothetical protein
MKLVALVPRGVPAVRPASTVICTQANYAYCMVVENTTGKRKKAL